MGVATVRAALVQFFQPGADIPGLNKVLSAPPLWADGGDWQLNKKLGSGAVAALHMVEDAESRITVPVLTGQKIVTYKVGLMIFYQWLKQSSSLAPADEDAWAAPLDVIIDGVKARLRSDPNCGMPAVVWQAGQDPNDIRVQRDIPRQTPSAVVAWNVVEFTVNEIITA